MAQRTVGVEGMTCTACASRLERVVARVPGVTAATVQFATATARVEFADAAAPMEDVVAAIRAAGFDVAPSDWSVDAAPRDPAVTRAVWACVLAAPVVVAAMAPNHGVLADAVEVTGTVLVMLGPARSLLREGLAAARAASGELALLVSLGAFAAVAASLPAVVDPTGEHGRYWEAAAGSLALVLVGRALEARARRTAYGAVSALWRSIPSVQTLADGRRVSLETLRIGDAVAFCAGDTVAVDGVLREGTLAVDRSAWTGEPAPVLLSVGDAVRATERVVQGQAVVVARALGRDAQAARVAQAVLEAQAGRAPSQRVADAWAARLVPLVLALSLATWGFWTWAGFPADGVRRALAVLVVACPCALGLATPMALWAVSARAARGGIVVRDPSALEAAAAVDMVVLDKTGTLTLGTPEVVAAWGEPFAEVGALAGASLHPLARALSARLGPQRLRWDALEEVAGSGVRASLGAVRFALGAMGWVGEASADLRDWADGQRVLGRSVVAASRDGRVCAAWAMEDALRPGMEAVLRAWSVAGRTLVCLTGDATAAAQRRLEGLPLTEIVGGASPEAKARWVRERIAQGHRIAMIGDGTNDAEALSAATVGLAVGTGTSLAQGAAGLVLLDPSPVVWQRALALGAEARSAVRRNLAWAAGYNLMALPLAAGVWVPWGGPDLHPMVASGLMALSSLGVVAATAWALTRRREHDVDPAN